MAITLLGGVSFLPFSQMDCPQHQLPRRHFKQQQYSSHHTHVGPTQPLRPESRMHRVCHEPLSSVSRLLAEEDALVLL